MFAVGEHDASLTFMAQPDQITDDIYNNALVIVTDTANTERVDDQRYTQGKWLSKLTITQMMMLMVTFYG